MEDSNINIPTEIEANKTKKTQKKERFKRDNGITKNNYHNVLQRRVQKGHKHVNTIKCKGAKPTKYK